MAMNKLTRKQKISIAIAAILIVGFLVGIGFILYYYLVGTSPTVRKKMVEYHENDENYFDVCAKITSPTPYKYNDPCVSVAVEFVGGDNGVFTDNEAGGLKMPLTNYNAIVENGLDTSDGEAVYRFTVAAGSWYGQVYSYAVAVYSEDGEAVYLDYETGKADLLYYIKNDMT